MATVLHSHKLVAAMEAMAGRRDHLDLGQTTSPMTLRIERSTRQGFAVFALSGRMKAEEVAELKALFDTDYRSIILDLRDVRLADRDAVKFLRSCEREGMKLENCAAYVREWMDSEED